MAIVINNLLSSIESSNQEIIKQAVKKLGVNENTILASSVIKSSVDARRDTIKFVSSVSISLDMDEQKLVEKLQDKDVICRVQSAGPSLARGTQALNTPPIIVGFGPAGMFAALILAKHGFCPIVIERGGDVDSRVKAVENFWSKGALCDESNVQFGEGGAGTFSDGKLTTRIGDARCGYILDEFVKHGASEELRSKAKPHIGTDKLRNIVKSIRNEICTLGGDVRFFTKLSSIAQKNKAITKITTNNGDMETKVLVTAIGHSARDTFEVLNDAQVFIEGKAFSVGVRIEHLQEDIDKALYGRFVGHPNLPIGEYQLSHRETDRAAYTFCMCPGGTVVAAASESGGVVVNGMSEFARNKINANSALVVSVSPKDFGENWRDGIQFQRKLEQKAFDMGGETYRAPAQTVGGFMKGGTALSGRIVPTYPLGVEEANLEELLPCEVTALMRRAIGVFGRKLRGFDGADSVLTGVETRTSSPVRITRNEDLCSISLEGLYPCGEGAGYAGGIMSAAVDGIKVAEAIISKYYPKY